MRGAKRKIPCRRRSTESSSHANRCASVRPGCNCAGPNRPALPRRYRGDRSGDAGGDGVLCPLLGSLLYACISLSLRRRHVSWLSFPFSLSLSVSLCLCFGFLERKKKWPRREERAERDCMRLKRDSGRARAGKIDGD
jgi:hypothetical protein